MLRPKQVKPVIKASFVARRGAIAPLFAVMLPVLLVLVGFAVNLAYMQLVSTELKIATDAAAHAGGRAMSILQTADGAIAQAEVTLQANMVAGKTLTVGARGDGGDNDIEIVFGKSERDANGRGMYTFSEIARADVENNQTQVTSLGVISNVKLPMIFNAMNLSEFSVSRRSIATQVDRDIALVLDRSGSMLTFRDDELLSRTLRDLHLTTESVEVEAFVERFYWFVWRGRLRSIGYRREDQAQPNWFELNDGRNPIFHPATTEQQPLISLADFRAATSSFYDRVYSSDVIYELERWRNPQHTLSPDYNDNIHHGQLRSDMAQFASDWRRDPSRFKFTRNPARHSRWWFLEQGVDAFLGVLDETDQDELVSLVTFADDVTSETTLSSDYSEIRELLMERTNGGGTWIGSALEEGLVKVIDPDHSRTFAAKTIVILTDGVSSDGAPITPQEAVQNVVGQRGDITIHTVTFTEGADEAAMQAVAEAGRGRHYHADEGEALVDIFEEIANNLPTILTE